MSRLLYGVLLLLGSGACAAPRAAGAPLAPLGRSWAVPTLGLYQEWWDKTVACSGQSGSMKNVSFYAVDAPSGAIELAGEMAHAWWAARGTGSIFQPMRWATNGWYGMKCFMLYYRRAATRPKSLSKRVMWHQRRYGGIRL